MINTEYVVYFEIFGKKMKTVITAPDKKGAEKAVKDKIIFHKVVEKKYGDTYKKKDVKDFVGNDQTFKNLKDIFRMK